MGTDACTFSNTRIIDLVEAAIEAEEERRLADAAARRTASDPRNLCMSLFHDFPELIWRSLPDGSCDYFNLTWLKFTGRTLEQELGHGWAEGVHPEDRDRCMAHYMNAVSTRTSFQMEYRLRHHSGDYRTVTDHGCPLFDQQGVFAGYIGICHDITDDRLSQQMLRRALDENRILLASLSSVLVATDAEGRIVQWNEAAEQAFRTPAPEVLGRFFAESPIPWRNNPHLANALHDCMMKGTACRVEDVCVHEPEGRESCWSVTVNPIKGVGGGFVFLGRDMTEQKHKTEQAAQTQKLEAIGRLAAGIAHEINTPVQYIGDNLSFLKEAFEKIRPLQGVLRASQGASPSGSKAAEVASMLTDPEIAYLLSEIPQALEQSLDGVHRVSEIVRAMKQFSHPGVERQHMVDINAALANTATVARNEWKYVAEMDLRFDPALPPVPCFPGDLNQVFLNLIVNAAHAISERTDNHERGKGRIVVQTRREGMWAEIHVSDTGIGIPKAIRERIFDPFFTTKPMGKGSGQGLAIAHHVIAKKHGGQITFTTAEGKGSTFVIRLPITRQEKRRASE